MRINNAFIYYSQIELQNFFELGLTNVYDCQTVVINKQVRKAHS